MNDQEKKNLLTIIALAGNKRLIHLEEEIFSDKEVALVYLTGLYPKKICDNKNYRTEDILHALIYNYSRFILKERWPVAEPFLFENIDLKLSYLKGFKK